MELKCINFIKESFYNECHGAEQFCCYVAGICNMCELKSPHVLSSKSEDVIQ